MTTNTLVSYTIEGLSREMSMDRNLHVVASGEVDVAALEGVLAKMSLYQQIVFHRRDQPARGRWR